MEHEVACSPIQFFKDPFGYHTPFYAQIFIHSISFTYPNKTPVCFSLFPSSIPSAPSTLSFDPPSKGDQMKWATQYSVLFSFLKLPLGPRYIPQHPILKHPQPMFFPEYDQPCFTPIYKSRHSIFRNDIPLWYMMINHKDTYISLFLAVCFDCCEKQIIILQCCNEIIMYFLIPLQSFSTKPKYLPGNKLI